jgi:hypothetical protein
MFLTAPFLAQPLASSRASKKVVEDIAERDLNTQSNVLIGAARAEPYRRQ